MTSRRVYRRELSNSRLASFTVQVKESDLWVAVPPAALTADLPARLETFIWRLRRSMEAYLRDHPHLTESLEPCLCGEDAPPVVQKMVVSANRAGVGPMAAVAGAVAEAAGEYLQPHASEIIVENGGDIYLKITQPLQVGLYAGCSPFSGNLALLIRPDQSPLGICTSSGKVGPSLSLGRADAAIAVSASAPLADAAATALGNMVKGPGELNRALDFARTIEGLSGALLICENKIAIWGDLELQKL